MRLAPSILLPACLAASTLTSAAEWSAAPQLGWTVDHDSNRALSEDAQAAQGAYLNVDLLLKRASPNSSLSLRPHVSFQRFTGNVTRDSDDESVIAAGSWRTERSQLNATTSVVHRNTLDTAFIDEDLVGLDTRRRSKTGQLNWSYQQKRDRNALILGVGYSDVDYQGNTAFRSSGYRYPNASITQAIGFSPRGSLQLTAYGSRVDSDANQASKNIGAQIGLNYALTPHLSGTVTGGYSRQTIEQSFGPFTFVDREQGYTGELSLTRNTTRGQWRLFGSRSVAPSGFGALVTRTEAGLSMARAVTPRWRLSLSMRNVQSDDVGILRSGEVHAYQRLDSTLSWQAARTWTLSLGANVNRLQRHEDSPYVEGWRTWLSTTWTPRPSVLSR